MTKRWLSQKESFQFSDVFATLIGGKHSIQIRNVISQRVSLCRRVNYLVSNSLQRILSIFSFKLEKSLKLREIMY